MIVFFDVGEGYLAGHHFVRPAGVQNDDRHKDDGGNQHDAQREVARDAVPYRQT